MGDAALAASAVGKTYGATAALRDVSLTVHGGEVLALLGQNGCGKSTFVKLVSGVERPDPGSLITVGGQPVTSAATAHAAGVRVVHQKLGLFEGATVAENLALGPGLARRPLSRIRWRVLHRQARATLDRFGVDVDTKALLGTTRPAQRAMIAIARALAGREHQAGVLILDEPTAALPEAEREQLLAAVRRYRDAGHAIVYVTHYLDEVSAVADSVAVLRNGALVASLPAGDASHAELVRLVTGHEPVPTAGRPATAARPAAVPRLAVSGLAGPGVREADFAVYPGEIVGIAGLADCGASELLRLVFGAARRQAGTVRVDGQDLPRGNLAAAVARGVAYVPPERARQAAFTAFDVRENVSAAALPGYYRGGRWQLVRERRDASALIAEFDIRPPRESTLFSALSGGNQQKVIMARWLRNHPGTILLDHPTQGVDVGARAAIRERLVRAADAGAAVVVVTSDFDELAQLCHRVIVMARGRIHRDLDTGAPMSERGISDAVYRAAARA